MSTEFLHAIEQTSIAIQTDKDSLQTYGKDWTTAFTPNPTAILFPTTTEDVQHIVKLANQHQTTLVPSGGRTGYSGGAVANNGEVVVSFNKMNRIVHFNDTTKTVLVEAGVVLKTLQDFARDHNLFYPVDLASSGSCQIGGNIATNAGGIKVIRYGHTRHWVAGLTVVTGKGDIISFNKGLTKNATGYDLRHLMIGSEGTLGFITEALMQFTHAPQSPTVLMLGIESFDAILPVLHAFKSALPLTAFEFFSDCALEHVIHNTQLAYPFDKKPAFYTLIEFENHHDAEDTAMQIFKHCIDENWLVDGVMSQSNTQAQQLWALRDNISESLIAHTPFKHDFSVTIDKMPAFLTAMTTLLDKQCPAYDIVWFGHIGDGNVHMNILKPDHVKPAAFLKTCDALAPKLFDIVAEFEGSISAEHGIGLLKKPYLSYSRSEAEIALMRDIKQAFDPNNIMNPGKLLP